MTVVCTKKERKNSLFVPRTGLEPVHPEVLVFETNASTNSAIWAFCGAKLQKIIEPRNFLDFFLYLCRQLQYNKV